MSTGVRRESERCLIQFTDTHLFRETKSRLLGIPTHASLKVVLEQIHDRHPEPDAYLVTGDLAQEPHANSYRHLARLLDGFSSPIHVIPGNHDDQATMESVFNGGDIQVNSGFELGEWFITMLDSTVPGKEHGFLPESELARLVENLQGYPAHYHIVCFHHPATELGSRWMDHIGLRNADALFSVLDAHASVKAVLWGHAHQEFDETRNGIRMLGTPSTCFQFAPQQDDFGVDAERHPGYRVIFLARDGELRSHVERVEAYPYTVDVASEGY